ncbi:hypothetical protein KQX54_008453 [Cotesia glomerata]|uniref:Uncharacterized protein n=1 Tax=Cotesia glomerata TaxID=32391 RepID=A0AAV7ITD9_COTGL|nr:hypothetical protein KQX54_008453 [Cotesia glomerata]
MPPKNKKLEDFTYALIWFISTKERYVVETNKLPKTRRKKGNVIKILWEDPSTQISTRYEVKILEFDNDKTKLENILLDEDGNVCDENAKLFFRSVLDKKRALQEGAKLDVAKNKIQKTSLAHASCSKTNEFQHQFTEIAQIEYNDTSSDKSSPEPNDDGQINTPGIANNLNETSEENIESLELSDENEVDIGALHTFFPVTGKLESQKHIIFFFTKSTIAFIEKRTESSKSSNLSDWKNLVKEALIEVYGNNLQNYRAKGTRVSRLPIHPQLYQAILAWANSRSEQQINEADYVGHINKIASNKRKTNKSKSTSKTCSKLNDQQYLEPRKTALEYSSIAKIHNSPMKLNPPLSEPLRLSEPRIALVNSNSRTADYRDELSLQPGITSESEYQQHIMPNIIHPINVATKIVNNQNSVIPDAMNVDEQNSNLIEPQLIFPVKLEYIPACDDSVNRQSWTTQDQYPCTTQSSEYSSRQYPNSCYSDQHSGLYTTQHYNYYPPVKNFNENNKVFMQRDPNDCEYQYHNQSTPLISDSENPNYTIL